MARITDNLDHLEDQVSEVTHLLKQDVEKVLERGERIDDLQNRSEELEAGSHHFRRKAGQVRRKMCWQNCRLNCIIASVIMGIIAVIAVIVLVTLKPWEHSSGHSPNNTQGIAGMLNNPVSSGPMDSIILSSLGHTGAVLSGGEHNITLSGLTNDNVTVVGQGVSVTLNGGGNVTLAGRGQGFILKPLA